LPVLEALCRALEERGAPAEALCGLKVVVDWVQYRQNFREPVVVRAAVDGSGPLARREIAIDLRQVGQAAGEIWPEALAGLGEEQGGEAGGRIYLERFGPLSRGVIWSFNAMYWRYLAAWERASGRSFLEALPGGDTDAANPAFLREQIAAFLIRLAELERRRQLPEEIFVLELGVGNGQQSRRWLDEFRAQCRAHGLPYYPRLRYLMSDNAQDVLAAAREAVREHLEQVSVLQLDAADPLRSLAFLRYKILLVHISNVYDNLPTDELVRWDGRYYTVEARAYLPGGAARRIARDHGLAPEGLPGEVARLLRFGPEVFADGEAGLRLWREVWAELRLEERYVALAEPDGFPLAPGLHGGHLTDLLAEVEGDLRMHLSTVALQSFANTVPLLHPRGEITVLDIFVTDLAQYRTGFRGPGKLDGSVVNWVNGPLLAAVAERAGYRARFAPFRYRPGSSISVLTASPKE